MSMKEHQQFNLPDESDVPLNPQHPGSSDNIERIDKTLDIKGFYMFGEKEAMNMKGQKFNRTQVIGSVYSAAVQDFLIGVASLGIAPSIGLPLPALAGSGKYYIVKDEVGGAGTTSITIRSEGEATIDGAATATINTNYGAKEFYSNGVSWFIK